jgi:hypothetical protein
MAGLPKKYAKMGFKKGWAAYRRSKSGGRKRTASRKARPMARRKRTSRRRYYGKKRRTSRRSKSMSLGDGVSLAGVVIQNIDLKDQDFSKLPYYAIERVTGYKAKAIGGTEVPSYDMDNLKYTFSKFWGPIVIGTIVKKAGPKIPFVKSLPKRIPVIGKFIRW